MKKKISVPAVTYTVIYNDEIYYYRELLDEKGSLTQHMIFDFNNVTLDEESDLYNEIMDYIESTFDLESFLPFVD